MTYAASATWKTILARTQGIPIFQEQAMAIAMKLGGYTATQADLLAPHDGQHAEEGHGSRRRWPT